ncbi:uncharacterized protein V1518DRAFT_422738 [Limtongia smithiae]|uniref:uncharacterized protein n=1 Tax=Limtongia smithiae TaxID=1125753 RepID=UPI0034D007AC
MSDQLPPPLSLPPLDAAGLPPRTPALPPPPFQLPGRELPPLLQQQHHAAASAHFHHHHHHHHRGASGGMSISSMLGSSSPPPQLPPLASTTAPSTPTLATAPAPAPAALPLLVHAASAPPTPASPHHHHHTHHHHHYVQDASAPVPTPESASAPAEPDALSPPVSKLASPSPFSVGPTLPPVQYDPSQSARRVTEQTHLQEPLPSLAGLTMPDPSPDVRAEDAVARVVKKAAAAAAAASAQAASPSSEVGSSTPLAVEKIRKKRHAPHARNASHMDALHFDTTLTVHLTVESASVYAAASAFPSHNLGSLVYTPTPPPANSVDSRCAILPRLDDRVNSIIQVRIARRFLLRNANPHVTRRRVWGTDVYTDDSDVVAALYHAGFLPPARDVGAGDCVATLRILPVLVRYQGCFRNGINSRTWLAPHDGVSFRIEAVQFVGKGKAEDRGWPMKKRRLEEWRVTREWSDGDDGV